MALKIPGEIELNTIYHIKYVNLNYDKIKFSLQLENLNPHSKAFIAKSLISAKDLLKVRKGLIAQEQTF